MEKDPCIDGYTSLSSVVDDCSGEKCISPDVESQNENPRRNSNRNPSKIFTRKKTIFYLLFGGFILFVISLFALGGCEHGIDASNRLPKGINYPQSYLNEESSSSDEHHLVVAQHAAVACDVPQCSKVGSDIMQYKGGNAADAVIAAAFCIGVINSHSSGIGGGGFMVVRPGRDDDKIGAKSINFREKAPEYLQKEMFDGDPEASRIGGLAAGIPGEVAGLWEAHKLYAKLPWKELIEPSIKIAKEGYKVTEYLDKVYKIMESNLTMSNINNGWDFLMIGPNGTIARKGDIVKRPALATTLETIADKGPEGFYKGEVALNLYRHIRNTGGVATVGDFENYTVEVTEPIRSNFRDREILTCPSPCSGPALVLGLNIMDGLNMSETPTPLSTHYLIEAMKWMAAGRTELGDGIDIDNSRRIQEIMTSEYAEKVRNNISDDHTLPWQEYNPAFSPNEESGTAHLSVLDKDGMAISMTTTVNLPFGNQFCDDATGIVMNSEMDDFSQPHERNAYDLAPSVYNYVYPRKRPLSSIATTIVIEDGQPRLVVGAAGGSHIVTTVFQGLVSYFDYEMDLYDVIKQPRFHNQLIPETSYYEETMDKELIKGLVDRGHNVSVMGLQSVMNGIARRTPDSPIHAVSDWWRKRSEAAGY